MYAYHALQMAEFHFQSIIMSQTFTTLDTSNLLDQIIKLMDPGTGKNKYIQSLLEHPTKEIYSKVRLNP